MNKVESNSLSPAKLAATPYVTAENTVIFILPSLSTNCRRSVHILLFPPFSRPEFPSSTCIIYHCGSVMDAGQREPIAKGSVRVYVGWCVCQPSDGQNIFYGQRSRPEQPGEGGVQKVRRLKKKRKQSQWDYNIICVGVNIKYQRSCLENLKISQMWMWCLSHHAQGSVSADIHFTWSADSCWEDVYSVLRHHIRAPSDFLLTIDVQTPCTGEDIYFVLCAVVYDRRAVQSPPSTSFRSTWLLFPVFFLELSSPIVCYRRMKMTKI